MAAIGAFPADAIDGYVALGELGLDGRLAPTNGVLAGSDRRPCPRPRPHLSRTLRGGGRLGRRRYRIVAPALLALVNHLGGYQLCSRPLPRRHDSAAGLPDLPKSAARRWRAAPSKSRAAGGHNLLMIGPPGAGKSMLAQRLAPPSCRRSIRANCSTSR